MPKGRLSMPKGRLFVHSGCLLIPGDRRIHAKRPSWRASPILWEGFRFFKPVDRIVSKLV